MFTTDRNRYRAGLAAAIAGALFMLFLIGAVGIIGVEGDPFDLIYLGVLAVGLGGAIVARFRPDGMARAMFVTAAALGVVAVIALLAGKHRAEVTSVAEVLGLNGMFAVMFAASGWLLRSAAGQHSDGPSPAQ